MSDNVDWTQICQRNVKHTLGERLARDARQESAADLELGEAPSSSDAPAMASRPRSVDVVGEVEGCLDAADGDAGGFLANGSLIHRPTGSGEGKRELLMCYDERTMTLVFYCALHPKKPIDAIVPTSRQQSRSFLADASGSSLACDNARNAHNSFSEYVSLVDAVGLEHVRSVEPTSNTSLDRKEGCNIALTVYYAPRRTGGPSSFFSWLGNTATTTIRLVRLDGESLEEMSQRRDRILFILRSLMLRMPTRFAKREVPRSGTWIIDEVTLAARPKLRNEEIRRMLGRPKGLREEFSEVGAMAGFGRGSTPECHGAIAGGPFLVYVAQPAHFAVRLLLFPDLREMAGVVQLRRYALGLCRVHARLPPRGRAEADLRAHCASHRSRGHARLAGRASLAIALSP